MGSLFITRPISLDYVKTRDELIAMHMDSSNGEAVDETLTELANTGECLKEMAEMVEAAHLRVLATMVAAHERLKANARQAG